MVVVEMVIVVALLHEDENQCIKIRLIGFLSIIGFFYITRFILTTPIPLLPSSAGLEVILEEPEEEYCSSHVSEDELRRDVDITFGLKCERRSLDGSEGIGSAEGDTQSSGGSDHCVEEDCASSGIHSEGEC